METLQLKYAFLWRSRAGKPNVPWSAPERSTVVELVIAGQGWLDLPGGRALARTGAVVWSRAGEIVMHEYDPAAPYHVVALHFIHDEVPSGRIPPRLHQWTNPEDLQDFADEVLTAYQAFACDMSLLARYAYTRLQWSAEQQALGQPHVSLPAGLRRAIDLIEHRFARPLHVRDLARAAGCGATRLHELFRIHLGTTPLEHLMQRRLREARHLLAHHADLPVHHIGTKCGFPDAANFGRVFKQRVHQTPLAWRRAHAVATVV